ncbi:MAG TPA: anthrone oxygenase family protein [Thermoanaerobaculia bacterium]|nr:anthrone oxygenase family protein [Thermoanaerobaculia bacterium]
MTDAGPWLFALTLVSALGCGLIAGAFFAFSSFVMSALGRLPPASGIAAMQSINIVVINPVFLGVFLGTAAACLGVLISAFLRWPAPGTSYAIAGSALYIAGTFLVTMAFNVPRNNMLAAVDPASHGGARVWAGYLVTWTRWNHVRTAAALAAAALLIMALVQAG